MELHESEQETITVCALEFVVKDPEWDPAYREAIRLRYAGDTDGAYRRLKQLHDSLLATGRVHVPIAVDLANLMRQRGELDDAQNILEMLAANMPGEPVVLYNLAGLWIERDEWSKAQACLARIRVAALSDDIRQQVQRFKEFVNRMVLLTSRLDPRAFAEAQREEVDKRSIPLQVTLRQALGQIPVQWLNAVAGAYGIRDMPRRREREQAVAGALRSPRRVQEVLATLPPEALDALRYVLERGGWCRLQVLTRRFGSMDGDGFWWNEAPPRSPIGRLRVLGLLFVGRAFLDDGRQHRVAVVPVELRPVLNEMLQAR